MRVLYVLEFDHMQGGMQHAVEMLIRYGREVGVESAVLVPAPGAAAEAFREAGAVVYTGAGAWRFGLRPFRFMMTLCRFMRLLQKCIKQFNPQIIETNNVGAEILCGAFYAFYRCKIPRVFGQRVNVHVYRGLSLFLLRLSLRSVSAVVLKTPSGYDQLASVLGVPPCKMKMIRDATELHHQPPVRGGYRREWGIPDDALVAGIVGYIDPNKSQETFVEVAALTKDSIPNAVFLIAGGRHVDPEYTARLDRRVADLRLGDRVRFTGFVDDKRRLFDTLDVVLSTSRMEGFGLTIIEAMAAAKPVIATRSGGPEYIIEDEMDGYLVDLNDAPAIAARLKQLAGDLRLRNNLGVNGLRKVERTYDPVQVTREYLSLYESMARRTERGSCG